MAFERALHIDWERSFAWLNVRGSAAFYDWAEIAVMAALVTYVVVAEVGPFWDASRNSLALICAGGFLCFYLFPVAPPRLLPPSYGFQHFGLGSLSGVADQVAAMPSLHTAFAGWVALVWRARFWGRGWFSHLGWAYVVLTAVVVVATGNHYVLDVAAGELLALGSVWVALRWTFRHRFDVVTSPAQLVEP